WVNMLRKNSSSPDLPMLLSAAKIDLIQDDELENVRSVAKNFVEEYDFNGYIFNSSKTGENVKETFYKVVDILIERTERKLKKKGR
ncbi:MAG: hypothetical protein ACFFCS_09255, partial [Candidatus Hodarchaeota archaeon]